MFVQVQDLDEWIALVVTACNSGATFKTLGMLAAEKGCTRQAIHKSLRSCKDKMLLQGPARLVIVVDNVNPKELLKVLKVKEKPA